MISLEIILNMEWSKLSLHVYQLQSNKILTQLSSFNIYVYMCGWGVDQTNLCLDFICLFFLCGVCPRVFEDYHYKQRYTHTDCICRTFLHCVPSCVSEDYLLGQRRTHTGYICGTSLRCESSGDFSVKCESH